MKKSNTEARKDNRDISYWCEEQLYMLNNIAKIAIILWRIFIDEDIEFSDLELNYIKSC